MRLSEENRAKLRQLASNLPKEHLVGVVRGTNAKQRVVVIQVGERDFRTVPATFGVINQGRQDYHHLVQVEVDGDLATSMSRVPFRYKMSGQ